jgi:hypothetical protein
MHRLCSTIACISVYFLLSLSQIFIEPGEAATKNNDDQVIATVGDDPITLGDLNSALISLHESTTPDTGFG